MRPDITLYAITDASYKKIPIEDQARCSIEGGATIIQLREKNIPVSEYVEIARRVHQVTSGYNIPLIINDSIETALLSGAEGVHLGQGDESPYEARKFLGNEAIIGITAKTEQQAVDAEKAGADYLGSGAMFVSPTKPDAIALSTEELKKICKSVSIPVCAIGGITAENALSLKKCGISGIAVVSSLFGSEICEQIVADAIKLKKAALEAING